MVVLEVGTNRENPRRWGREVVVVVRSVVVVAAPGGGEDRPVAAGADAKGRTAAPTSNPRTQRFIGTPCYKS